MLNDSNLWILFHCLIVFVTQPCRFVFLIVIIIEKTTLKNVLCFLTNAIDERISWPYNQCAITWYSFTDNLQVLH